MTQKIVALVGISGAGKTTFLERLSSLLTFQHLTAGTLISAGKSHGDMDRDQLRLSDIDQNQQLLVSGFQHARDLNMPLVVIDGHVIVHGETGIEIVGADIFRALGINAMAHLVAEPTSILENRLKDTTRKRPTLSEGELEEHQNHSIAVSQKICEALNVPWQKVTASEIDKARNFLLGI